MQLIEIKRKIDSTEAKKKLTHYRIIDRDFSLTKVTPKEKVICFYENTKNNHKNLFYLFIRGAKNYRNTKKIWGLILIF